MLASFVPWLRIQLLASSSSSEMVKPPMVVSSSKLDDIQVWSSEIWLGSAPMKFEICVTSAGINASTHPTMIAETTTKQMVVPSARGMP